MGDFVGIDDAGAGILVGFAVLALSALVLAIVFPVIALTLELVIVLTLSWRAWSGASSSAGRGTCWHGRMAARATGGPCAVGARAASVCTR
jgi:hypothetical protein